MTTALRANRINIDLGEYKQAWLNHCKAHSITPSEAFRRIVAKLTTGAASEPNLQEALESAKRVRREIRLTRSELARAELIAKQEGFSLTRWIVALINARLDKTPQLGQRELEALARSNMQMLAIGRNLNQLARAANHGIPIDTGGTDLIEALRTAVMQHVEQVACVITANTRRWSH